MGFFSYGKRVKPKPFGFVPRFYDEQKEEREARLKKISNPDDLAAAKDRIKSGLRSTYRGDVDYKKNLVKKSNLRLVYIILALALITVFFLRSEALADMIRSLGG